MSALPLRRVARALAWYGAATTDQLARELDLERGERPALEAALEFWVRRGEARRGGGGVAPGAGATASPCAGGCCPRGASSARHARGASSVWVWTGEGHPAQT